MKKMKWEDTADECIRKLDEAIKHINAINKILVDTAHEYQAEIATVMVKEAEDIANERDESDSPFFVDDSKQL